MLRYKEYTYQGKACGLLLASKANILTKLFPVVIPAWDLRLVLEEV